MSRLVKDAGARAMLYACYNNINRQYVGLGATAFSLNPCNKHLFDKIDYAEKCFDEWGFMNVNKFLTTGISDGMTNGNSGMRYSLPSRELISDSIVSMCKGHQMDKLYFLAGCDKNIPGAIMGAIETNIPTILCYGGSTEPGTYNGKSIDIVNAFKEQANEKINEKVIKSCCPKSGGACGGMYTANTMAVTMEVLGLSLPNTSVFPANSEHKLNEIRCGTKWLTGMDMNFKPDNLEYTPREIISKESLLNAIRMTIILGGSTNAILHILAISNKMGGLINIDDIDNEIRKSKTIMDFQPIGKYRMYDLFKHNNFSMSTLIEELINKQILIGDTKTIYGELQKCNKFNVLSDTGFENYGGNKSVLDSKFYKELPETGTHIKILKGNISPKGCVAKVNTNKPFVGKAIVFESEEDFIKGFNKIKKGHVIVMKSQGPKSGPGMPEMLKPTSMLLGSGFENDVALITDGRFSGGSSGNYLVGHITPETSELDTVFGLIIDGDKIVITNESIDLVGVSEDELEKRKLSVTGYCDVNKEFYFKFRMNTEINPYDYLLRRFRSTVTDATNGCIQKYW